MLGARGRKAREAGELLRSIDMADVAGLRDRALIGERRHEKGGKFHEIPYHHTLEAYLGEHIENGRLAEAGWGAPLPGHQV